MKLRIRTLGLLATTSLTFGIIPASAAWSQTVPPADPATTDPSTDLPDATTANPQVVDPASGDIVVTGFRQSLQNAQTIKKNASEIVDSIVAEDIGKLPDNNLSEALQRVPGVQIARNHGEGSGIAIRGLSQVKTLVNGREVFSDAGRDLSLENVPAEILAGVDVYKNPSATLVEGGLGGVVNLKTRKPFDFPGFQASISARANYWDMIDKAKPQISALISNRFDTGLGELGVLVGGALIKSAGRFDQNGAEPYVDRFNMVDFNNNGVFVGTTGPRNGVVAPATTPRDPGDRVIAPGGGGESVEITDRTRMALYSTVQWKPSSSLEFFLEGTYNDYKYEQASGLAYANRGNLFVLPGAPITFYEGTNVVKSATYRDVQFTANNNYFDRKAYTWQVATGGTWKATDNLDLVLDLSYTKSSRTDKSGGIRTGTTAAQATGINLFFDTSTPLVTLDLTGADFLNPALYSFLDSSDSIEKAGGSGKSARLDGNYRFDDSVITSISVGGRFATREVERNQGSRSHLGAAPLLASPQPISVLPGILVASPYGPDFFRNTDSPTIISRILAPDLDQIRDTETICRAFNDAVCYPTFNPLNRYALKEDTYAAFGQVNFNFPDILAGIDGNVGLRYLKTDLSIVGVLTQPNGAVSNIDQDSSYTNLLPSANVRVKLTNDLFLRLAGAKQLTRPNFNNLSPTLGISFANAGTILQGSAGNPDLRPLRSTSYDASLEYYFTASGYVYLTGFIKKVDGFVQNVVTTEPISLPDYPNFTEALITRPQNGDNGTIKGLEVGVQTFFDFLPAPFDGLGTQANYTFVDSNAPGPIAGTSVPIQGLSKHSYNLVGFYEKAGFRARVAYNYRSDYVESTSGPGSGALPIFVEPFAVLDASVGYSINKNIDVSVDASNITKAVNHTYFGEQIRPRFNNLFDRRIGLVVRIKS
jgi:TonB-dependent receptor